MSAEGVAAQHLGPRQHLTVSAVQPALGLVLQRPRLDAVALAGSEAVVSEAQVAGHLQRFAVELVTAATAGQAYAYQAVASDPDGAVITYLLLDGPAGLVLDGATGTLS